MSEETKPPTTTGAVTEQDKGRCAPAPGSAHVISGKRMTCLISNAHSLLKARYRKSPLWALVADLTGNGSTYSVEICLQAGYDPNQNCGLAKLKASAPNDQAHL